MDRDAKVHKLECTYCAPARSCGGDRWETWSDRQREASEFGLEARRLTMMPGPRHLLFAGNNGGQRNGLGKSRRATRQTNPDFKVVQLIWYQSCRRNPRLIAAVIHPKKGKNINTRERDHTCIPDHRRHSTCRFLQSSD
jgi:hypothetical protein